jgi:hypothetical protein
MGVRKVVIVIAMVVRLLLFRDDLIIYVENSIEFIKYLFEVINGLNKIAEYKINWQQPFVFYILAINNSN